MMTRTMNKFPVMTHFSVKYVNTNRMDRLCEPSCWQELVISVYMSITKTSQEQLSIYIENLYDYLKKIYMVKILHNVQLHNTILHVL